MTAEEMITAINAALEKKTTLEQFAEAMKDVFPEPEPFKMPVSNLDTAPAGYPVIKDGTPDPDTLPDGRTTQEQFEDWLNNSDQLTFDPFKDKDGWKEV